MTEIRDVLSARNMILQRNAALRSVSSNGLIAGQAQADFNAKLSSALGAQSAAEVKAVDAAAAPSFGSALVGALQRVDQSQAREDVMTESFERGETTDIAGVVMMQQQAGIEFEATLQIRNKLLDAYKNIMNMPLG
jgi:flagellar hook-basal body complex protein FliE